ncbi:MAG: hypothetical protein HS104_16485 [Polyangiaceae bacterium]|nr:hypothetical protein [Polyangiaceae bacterium]MCL4754739.1 hypothetical protein [Myxococcales bacterium]
MSAVTPGATRVTRAPAALVVAVGLVLAVSDDHLDEVREDVRNAGQLEQRNEWQKPRDQRYSPKKTARSAASRRHR